MAAARAMVKLRFLAILVLAVFAAPTSAQLIPEPASEVEPLVQADPFGRETPRGTVTGLINALAAQDYVRAAAYFDLGPEENDADLVGQGTQLARHFQAALDRGGTLLPYSVLSNEANGSVADGLAVDLERVGAFGEEGAAILLSRSQGPDSAPIWRVAPQTISELESRVPPAKALAEVEEESAIMVAGAPLRDWALLLGIAAGSFFLFWMMLAGTLVLMRAIIADREESTVYRLTYAALPPLGLFLAVVSFEFLAASVEVSIVARQTLLRYIGIVAWVALAWFALRLVDALARITIARMRHQERRQAVSVVTLLRRASKVLLLAIAFVAILDTLGFDVTTGIAALGIGGIALALGAQRAVENLVGSVSIVADQPLQIGDFCRVGDIVGTVEDIGMRSTRIRTAERTLVTIPNGDLSSREIENFAMRDRFLFNPRIGLEYGVSAERLRAGVQIIEQVLLDHSLIDSDGARARFANFGASSLDVEVRAYITVPDYAESRLVRQELLLAIFERLEAAGLTIALPTQKMHLVRDEKQ